ncbi:dynein axonemal heavy chain 11 isoform X2 [Taeniopygia guttata]|uniref:dynein axonemal heavy chain 11 isoform X2 n=1 Tax=Taeniopygia guttata TaxID=59729 RepID=UPI003BB894AF
MSCSLVALLDDYIPSKAPFPVTEGPDPIATLRDDAVAWSNEGDGMSTENATVLTNRDEDEMKWRWICISCEGQTTFSTDAPRLKTKNVNSTRIFISSFTLNWLTLTYKPVLQAQATFINFTVSRDRLEDQLLAEAVNARLTKKVRTTVIIHVAEAKENEAQDDRTREHCRPAAGRASLPYSGSISLGGVNPIYQLSLKVKMSLANFCFFQSARILPPAVMPDTSVTACTRCLHWQGCV